MGSKHNLLFGLIGMALVALGCFPGLFDWSNRIEPWIMGLPFVMFWMLLLNFLICVTFAVWFITDNKTGNLDVDIEKSDVNWREM